MIWEAILKMQVGNGSCMAEPSLNYLICLAQLFVDWIELENVEDYLNYVAYLLWVFTPLIIVFILPFFFIIFFYLSILFLHVYKRKNELKEAYSNSIWDGARKTLATLWDGHAAIWHGYEIHGLEKLPDDGPALIVYYHGALPVDYYYFVSRVILLKGRTIHSVGDHFLFKIPGFKPLLELFNVIHGPKEECVKALRNGHLLAISPGGVREALFSNENYILLWRNRTGFAQVAIDAKVGWLFKKLPSTGCVSCTSVRNRCVKWRSFLRPYILPGACLNTYIKSRFNMPIIPMFTQNVREGFRSLGCLRFSRWLYERFKMPLVPVYGGFPVKLRTYLGDPIPYEPNVTATELAKKTKHAVQSLIIKNQRIPGNIFWALLERFHTRHKED